MVGTSQANFLDLLPDHRLPVLIVADAFRIQFVVQKTCADVVFGPGFHVHDDRL